MALKIADNLTLPRDAATQTFALLARRGAGKTHAASVIAEEMLEAGFCIIWLDPIGVAWGLRQFVDGLHRECRREGLLNLKHGIGDAAGVLLRLGQFGLLLPLPLFQRRDGFLLGLFAGGGEGRRIRGLQYRQGLRREQLTVLTGYKRSSRDAYIQRLREKQLVAIAGDRVMATEAGIAALPNAEPLPRGQALRDFWMSRLPQGERAILEQLLRVYPAPIRRDDLDESTGYKRSSRDAYLNRLAAKELVREAGRGEVIASETLFE